MERSARALNAGGRNVIPGIGHVRLNGLCYEPGGYCVLGLEHKRNMKHIFLGLIRLYQSTLSRVLPPTCRFYPSCSQYSYEAIRRHGVWRGSWLAVNRIARCHPFNPGGYDPVPPLDTSAEFSTSRKSGHRSHPA